MRGRTEASQRLLLRAVRVNGTSETCHPFEPHLNTALPHVQRSRVPRSRQPTAGRVGSLRMYVVCCMLCALCMLYVVVIMCVQCCLCALQCVLCMSSVVLNMSRKTHRKHTVNNEHRPQHTAKTRKHSMQYRKIPQTNHTNTASKNAKHTTKNTTYHKNTQTDTHTQHTSPTPHQTENSPVRHHTKPKTYPQGFNRVSNVSVFDWAAVLARQTDAPACELILHRWPLHPCQGDWKL